MSSKKFFILTALVLGNANIALADAPLSAIDWLSDTVTTSAVSQPPVASDISSNASVEDVTVTTLGGPTPDAVGLLPVSVTGLPRTFWGATPSEELADLVRRQPVQSLPALEELLKMILLAELDAPLDADGTGALFLARIDKLLDLGSLDQAQALLERAGPHTPDLFRRWFDVALLTGTEHAACATLKDNADIAPTFPARVFCLARNGDWKAAAVTLETAKVLGYITKEEDALLARFLDPELFEGMPPLPIPKHITPLIFRMREAIGEPIPTASLPRAFANADLRSNIGWKSRIEAAERLARTGAIDANRLLGIYTERMPAASGGLWERVEAIQQFDTAISINDPGAVASTLPAVWQEMQHAHLEVPFAALYGERLARLPLHDEAAIMAFHVGLLSADYENIASRFTASTVLDRFLVALAQGDVNGIATPNAKGSVVKPAFQANTPPTEFAPLLASNQLGKAILQAITLFAQGADGDLEDVRKALLLLRSVGLEDTARRAAIQLMLLERRG